MNMHQHCRSNLDERHPLKKAQWIWPNGDMYLYNLFADFRYDFTLKTIPEAAPLYITADKSYRLYINGKYVCRGSARGYQDHWPFDEVDITDYLLLGHNFFAIEAYTPGISTFQYLHHAKAGLLCGADWGNVKIYSNDRDWLMRRSPAHRTDTARLTKQLDFQEWVDARQDDRSWITSNIPPDDWSAEGTLTSMNTSAPFGRPPYDDVEPRGIPMLREDVVAPQSLMCHGFGECRDNYRNNPNISWHFIDYEYPTIQDWLPGKDCEYEITENNISFLVNPSGDEKFHAVTLDLGRNIPGSLLIEVMGAEGFEIIDIHYHQLLRNGIPEFIAPRTGSLISLAGRLLPAAGQCHHEFYHIYGIRQFTLVVRNSQKTLHIKCSWRSAMYPFSMQGSFHCSDQVLNDIYSICRYTQQICSLDAYVDTPWREQAQWWGDARVQIRNTVFLDGDMRLAERGIRSIAGQNAPCGLTYGHAPTCSGACILPDFSLTWILTIWDFYWQTGNLNLFHEYHERIKSILKYFETKEARANNGLLTYDERFWLFEDWSDLPKEYIPTFLNLWHLYTLEYYAKLLEAANLKRENKRIRGKIINRRRLLKKYLFDSKSGLFVAALNKGGNAIGEASVHDQILALILHLAPDFNHRMIEKRLLPCLIEDTSLSCAIPSAFWSTYLIECALEYGYEKEALEYIKRKWSPMITAGSTWEVFDFGDFPGWSYTHAWSAHPAVHLVNILSGVKQLAPAWRKLSWQPQRHNINNFDISIPTPQGALQISWNKNLCLFVLNVPAGIMIDARLPYGKQILLKNGHYEFSV